MNFVNLFISPSGRINRAKFWIVVLCSTVFFLAVIGVTVAVSGSMSAIFGAALIAYIPLIYVGVINGIKRLHDRNKSGWWVLLFYGAPLALPFVAAILDGSRETSVVLMLLQLVSLVIWIWAIVELGCLRGTIGQNKYGPDPLAPEVLTPPVRTHA
jgi:uncharacterized membrane protein YhaH (DUF805 family)